MSYFGIEAHSASLYQYSTNSTPPTSATPTSMQIKLRAMMNDIKAAAPSCGDHCRVQLILRGIPESFCLW